MKKKFLALVLTLAMVLSLVPVTALAADETFDTTTKDVVYGHYDGSTWTEDAPTRTDGLDDKVTVDKTATKAADNQYNVTLTVQMKHKTTEVLPGAAATVLVIDTSGSMEEQTQCEKEEHTHDDTCYTWETCTQENHPLHYVWWKGEYVHIPRSSCKWDGNKYVYRHLTCNKEQHQHNNCGSTTRIAAAKVAAKNFLNSYRGGTVSEDGTWTHSATPLERYVSIVSFNKYVSKNDWVDVSTQDGYDAAIASINALSADGGTNLDAGLRMANAQLNNGTVKGMSANVVVLTDGKPTYHLKKAENQNKNSDVEIEGVKYSVKGKGYETSEGTYDQTVKTAATLRQAASVYTVCFGASNEELEAKDKPTVSKFLRTKIATQAEGQKYAYDANDTTDLYKAFAAISSSVVSGLNTGTVEDALPAGVSCTQDGIFDDNRTLTWELDPGQATKSDPDSNDFITYTYEKKYTVKIDSAAEGLNVVDGYVPLNLPTKLTVKNSDNRDVDIPFPIPAGKVTYSLTNFNKELVTKSDTLSFDTNGFTIPDTKDSTVTVGENGVTLLYKITVNGDKGAKFTVTDDGATLVSPKDNSINQEGSTFSGTVGNTGETVFYVSKHFDVTTDMTSVSNTARIAPGDNAKGPDNKEKTVITTVTEATPQTYTVIFDANGGKWTDNEDQRQQTYDNRSDFVTPVAENPTQQGYKFAGWAYKTSEDNLELITTFAGASVDRMMQLPKATGTSVTLYAVWKDNDTAPTGSLNYRINQYFIDETGKVANFISKPGQNTVDTAISALISDLVPQDRNFPNYRYEKAETKVNNEEYTDSKKLTQNDTVINLYYYLDSWKDGDTDPDNTTDDSLTDGDGIPDCKQILIQYQVYQEGNGLVTPEFEVVTVKDNKELTAIHGSSVTKAGTGYTFVTWTGQNATVTEETVGNIIDKTSAEKLKKEKCDLSKDTFEQGKSYTYTAIFLEDKIGGGDNKDQPDGIPDAWQCKVTFKVENGSWDDNTNKDIVKYVTKKNAEGNGSTNGTAKLTAGQIPPVGNQPNSGYTASGRWDKTPSTDLNITGDTVFTYTYDKKSGGSGGSGGSHKPTVTIPDDVPTGLNGKDHYAYVVGYPDGMVYPQKNITRAEVATIFFRLLTDETREANMTKSNSYNDMKDGAWYTCAVSTLSKMGIIKGYEDGSFKPDASISRAEFAAIAARFDPDGDKTPATFSDVSSHWAKDEISIAANHGWIKGYEDGSFKPDQKITRAETMTLVNRVLKRLPETKDDLHKDMKTWPDNQNESAWFYLAVQEATNSHYQKLKKDGTHETWESMRETRDWAALEK